MKRTFVLVILDGWGVGEWNESNPIHVAKPQAVSFIQRNFPSGALQAHGIAVGLPWEEEGNSEVGHLTIGAGKVLYQHFPRISMAIDDGSFFENVELKDAFQYVKQNNSALHLAGLLTSGNVHASLKHLKALIEMAKREGCTKLYLQLFADGRDSPPRSLPTLIKNIEETVRTAGVGRIASLSGRHFAMDRDSEWERTKRAYEALVGSLPPISDIGEIVRNAYVRGLTDEFIEPVCTSECHPIQDGDAVVFFNFREDSMRQIVEPFVNREFSHFPVKPLSNLYLVTFTEYQEKLKTHVAFPSEKVGNPLAKVLSDRGLTQIRIAETEKYAHVTYFFNGLRDAPFPNEYRVLLPSKKVVHAESTPEMMAKAITDRALLTLGEGGFDFMLINYANPDTIAHTGNYDATVKAISVVDAEISRLLKVVFEKNHVLVITSDHGNAETLLNLRTGEVETKHNTNPVPFYLVSKEVQKRLPVEDLYRPPVVGLLSDVAPTMLALMGIPKPAEMTGQSLLEQLL